MHRIALAALLGLAGCSQAEEAPKDAAPYDTSLPMKQYMTGVMQHAADDIYKRQGTVVDEKGTRSLFPQNDAEWQDAQNAGLVMAEMANELLIPGRRVNEPEWDKGVAGLRKVAREIAAAAASKNEQAYMEGALKLDEACQACHTHYAPGAH